MMFKTVVVTPPEGDKVDTLGAVEAMVQVSLERLPACGTRGTVFRLYIPFVMGEITRVGSGHGDGVAVDMVGIVNVEATGYTNGRKKEYDNEKNFRCYSHNSLIKKKIRSC